VVWRGGQFRFERLKNGQDSAARSPLWAVSRHGEFIRTMPYAEETTNEFDVRSIRWLADLLG
jgi:hypothetical protein